MSVVLHPALSGVRACIFDAGGTIVHPDWPRLSAIAEKISGRNFSNKEMIRAFGEMLKRVGVEMERDGFVLPDEMKQPHWTFRRMYAALGLDESFCAAIMEQLAISHADRHVWCGPDPEALQVLTNCSGKG